jgi:hypothetical protein
MKASESRFPSLQGCKKPGEESGRKPIAGTMPIGDSVTRPVWLLRNVRFPARRFVHASNQRNFAFDRQV